MALWEDGPLREWEGEKQGNHGGEHAGCRYLHGQGNGQVLLTGQTSEARDMARFICGSTGL